jgi:hypothetical protein
MTHPLTPRRGNLGQIMSGLIDREILKIKNAQLPLQGAGG